MSEAIPTPDGCQFTILPVGDAWRWRMTTPDGAILDGFAPDRLSARRSAAFAAFAAISLSRARSRRI